MYSGVLLRLLAQLRHDTLNQFLRVGETLHDELDVHHRLARPTLALAVDAVLAHQGHGVSDRVHSDRQTTARDAHHGFVMLQFFLLFIEYGHALIVSSGQGGA